VKTYPLATSDPVRLGLRKGELVVFQFRVGSDGLRGGALMEEITAELSFSLTVFDKTKNCTVGVGWLAADIERISGWWAARAGIRDGGVGSLRVLRKHEYTDVSVQ